MDEVKRISKDSLYEIAASKGFSREVIAKDYALTEILFLLKDIKGIYFKDGTALQKTLLRQSRLSEDIDFTATKEIAEIDSQITETIARSKLFQKTSHDKKVAGFTRIIVFYNLFNEIKGEVFIDLNKRAKLLLPPEKHEINHFYKEFIPAFSLNMLAGEELIAEKISAAVCRNKPRDHFDIFEIIKAGLPVNLELAGKKCRQQGKEFNIARMFQNASKLKNRWEKDLTPLLATEESFEKVMKALAKHFNLKEGKKREKNKTA